MVNNTNLETALNFQVYIHVAQQYDRSTIKTALWQYSGNCKLGVKLNFYCGRKFQWVQPFYCWVCITFTSFSEADITTSLYINGCGVRF